VKVSSRSGFAGGKRVAIIRGMINRIKEKERERGGFPRYINNIASLIRSYPYEKEEMQRPRDKAGNMGAKKIGGVPPGINFMACGSWRDVALFMKTSLREVIPRLALSSRRYVGRAQVCVQRKTWSVH